MSRFRKKANFMNMFGRAEDDRSLLHSSSKLEGSIGDMSGIYRKDTDLDHQPANDSPEEFSLNFLDREASTNNPSMNTNTLGSTKSQTNDTGGLNNQHTHPESPKIVSPDRAHRVEGGKSVSPRRTIREKLRGSLAAVGDHPVSPTKGSMRRHFSERILGTGKPLDRSPKNSKVNHIGEIKVNFATITEQNTNQPQEMKVETDSPPKSKILLKSFSKIARKSKEKPRVDAVLTDSLNTKVMATVQTVHSSDLQHSFHQLNLGEMVPEVFCEAVKSKELVKDLKKRNKDHYMMNDSSSEDESSTDVSEESLDVIGNETDEEQGNEDNDIARSAENGKDDLFTHVKANHVKAETQIGHGTDSPGGFDVSENKTTESHGPTENEISPSGAHATKIRKLCTNEVVELGRKPRRSKNSEHEVRTWVRSSSRDQQRRRSGKESTAIQTVELAFSPPSSPKIETKRCVTENDMSSRHEEDKLRKSPQSNRSSPRQYNNRDAIGSKKSNGKLSAFLMPDELNDPASDLCFAEMKAVLDDFERMDISDFLKHPNEHLKDVDLNMSTVPFTSCYIDVKDLDFSENTALGSMTAIGGGGNELQLIDSSPDLADMSCRFRRLHDELEQSKERLLLSSREVSRADLEIKQLKQRLDQLIRR